MTRRSKLASIGIIMVTGLVLALFLGLEGSGAYTLPTRGGVQATIQVAVAPPLDDWVREMARDFSERNRQIQIEVVALKGLDAPNQLSASGGNLPDAWIAEALFLRPIVGDAPYAQAGDSVAQDSLLWVAARQANNTVDGLNWQSIHDVALRDRQFRLALPPTNSISGLAACMSAAAAYHQLPTLERSLVDDGDFQRWLGEMLEAVPNRNLNPRDQLNSRPPQADVGLLMNSDLQQLDEERFDANPPIYNVVLDYPYFIRTEWPTLSASTANAHQVASERFRDFLIDSPQQAKLGEYGFEPAEGNDNGQSVEIDGLTLGALRGCWR